MMSRYLLKLCIIGTLLCVFGCDPGALVRSKVPVPIKDVLTFGSGGPGGQIQPIAAANITYPKPDGVYTAGESLNFQAEIKVADTKSPTKPTISWTLKSEKDNQPVKIGSAARVSKRVEEGKYQAELTVELPGQKVIKKVGFRTALRARGRISNTEGQGVPGVEITVTNTGDETVLSQLQSDNNGAFLVELPREGHVLVKPKKSGMSFFPGQRIVKFTKPPVDIVFEGIESEIENMRLSEMRNPSLNLTELCPGEQVLLGFTIRAKIQPKSFEVTLVQRESEGERVIPLELLRESTGSETSSPSPESRTLKLRLPSTVATGPGPAEFRLRLTVKDEKGNAYSVDSRDSVSMDVGKCFVRAQADGTALLAGGKLEESVAKFNYAEKLGREIDESDQAVKNLSKVYVNRAIARLLQAQAEKPDSGHAASLLESAMLDLNLFLRGQSDDQTGLLLKGEASYLAGNYKGAVKDFSSVLAVQAGNPEAKILRALAGLKSGLKKNVSMAVDDITEYMTANPQASKADLRKARSEALKLFVQYQDKKDEDRLDAADIPVPNISAVLDLKKYIRK